MLTLKTTQVLTYYFILMSDILLRFINYLYSKNTIRNKHFVNLLITRVLHVNILNEKTVP
jgi:hypothetical protein